MKFKLSQFAKSELRKYQVTRKSGYDMHNPDGAEEVYHWDMVIYKKTLRVATADPNSAIKVLNQLNGKILKSYGLKLGDIITVENINYRVVEILPRLYADFNEFVLEMMKDE
nr:MAG TPA: 26S protease regulatory subunit 7 [Caudoviricetes sp.]